MIKINQLKKNTIIQFCIGITVFKTVVVAKTCFVLLFLLCKCNGGKVIFLYVQIHVIFYRFATNCKYRFTTKESRERKKEKEKT